jgi:hypothetical protein
LLQPLPRAGLHNPVQDTAALQGIRLAGRVDHHQVVPEHIAQRLAEQILLGARQGLAKRLLTPQA